MVYGIAALTALFYLMALPVRGGIAWRSGHPFRLGVTIGPFRFSSHGNMNRDANTEFTASIVHDRTGKVREFRLTSAMTAHTAFTDGLPALFHAFKYLLHHTRPWRLHARIHFSLSSADKTALLYGLTSNVFSFLRALRRDLPLTASVTADFHSGHTQADLCGILSCRLGHIIIAALIGGQEYLCRRIHTWIINSPSKAS